MMRLALVLSLATLLPAAALAQTADDEKKKAPAPDAGAGQEVPLEEAPVDDTPSEDGGEENPDAPRMGNTPPPTTTAAPAAKRKRGSFPIEESLRPLQLPRATSEIALDAHNTTDPFTLSGTLRARYGITKQVQFGLRYNMGGAFDAGDGTEFRSGKAVAIDFSYLVFNFLAVQTSLPVYLDPFAVGWVFGTPLKFRFGDSFAIYGMQDFIELKLHEFVPSLRNESYNYGQALSLDSGTIQSDGTFRFSGGAVYQLKPQVALIGYFGVELFNFKSQDIGYPLEATIQYSLSHRIDLAARAGFDNLDDTGTFGLRLTAALRI